MIEPYIIFGFLEALLDGVSGRRDVRERGYEPAMKPAIYLPYSQVPDTWAIPEYLVIRTAGDPRALTAVARQAIAADSHLAAAHVYLAVAMGYEARIVGPVWARAHNYPGHAKDELDAALDIDAKDPWALGALGGWNVEIVRTGGERLASWIYGASVDQGLAAFTASFRAAPDNLSVRYQYALSLSGYDLDRFRHEVDDAFIRVAKLKAASAYELVAQRRAAELAALLKKGDRNTFDAKVRRYQGYP